MLFTMANLDQKQLEAVQSLEKKLGKTVIAFSGKDLNATQLKDDELAQIREAEKQLKVALVAIK
jgi:hypothetical protein